MTPLSTRLSKAEELRQLADRVKALAGPDREVDRAIANLLMLPLDWGMSAARYTASLDAAMTLVGDNHWRVEDHPLAGPCAVVGEQEGYAATPALAFVAAALRAQSLSLPAAERGE